MRLHITRGESEASLSEKRAGVSESEIRESLRLLTISFTCSSNPREVLPVRTIGKNAEHRAAKRSERVCLFEPHERFLSENDRKVTRGVSRQRAEKVQRRKMSGEANPSKPNSRDDTAGGVKEAHERWC